MQQAHLIRLCYQRRAGGSFGLVTDCRVRLFQSRRGLDGGVFGSASVRKLERVLLGIRPPSRRYDLDGWE